MKQSPNNYTPTIGLECHVQLKTKTKLFAAVDIADFDASPNTHISHICLGMPGALPVLNKQAVILAIRAAYALNTKPQPFSKFDRKHYFYPDLPKGYQITQYDQPIIVGGSVEFKVSGQTKKVTINRAHLEEDAGKTIHPNGKGYSLVDLNRAGTPLLEIVSEPDMHSAQEARAYAHELYLLMRYSGVSDADLYQGNMRFDVNISLSTDPTKLGTRAEIKNLNSFRSVEKAVEYEIKRQTKLLDAKKSVPQETRGWDDAKQKTFSQRGKEEAHDYRYFPEPDVPPLNLDQKFINDAGAKAELMPTDLREVFAKLKLDESAVETLVDSITAGLFMSEVVKKTSPAVARRIANWLSTDIQSNIASGELTWQTVNLNVDDFIKLSELVSDNKINSTGAKVVAIELVTNGGHPIEIATTKNLMQVSDESVIEGFVKEVIKQNKQAAEDIRKGEVKAVGFLVGQVMHLSGGQANPKMAEELIKRQLNS